MTNEQIIEEMTKTLISARSSLIFIYRETSMLMPLRKSISEAEQAISQIELCLHDTLLKEDDLIPYDNQSDSPH